jgi:protein SCO1/2
VCPLTLSDAAKAIDSMEADDGERTNLLMVSVDPARDDPATLDDYVGFFHAGFRGVGGPTEAIDRAASTYGVFYQLGEPDADGGYLVDHTGALLGIGPDGVLRVLWSSEVGPEALAADIEELLS